ncbi:MAG: hypothetical protein M3265_03445 [Actinomycetota bacterium]|nr:hypothetical protein [Actinomycetota bacterium]
MQRFQLVLALVALSIAAPVPALAQEDSSIARAVEALRSQSVYVDPAADAEVDAERLAERIREADAGPMYIAVLPAEAADEVGGDTREVLTGIASGLRRNGTYAAVVGRSLRAGATEGTLPEGVAPRTAAEVVAAHQGGSVEVLLEDFIVRIGEAKEREARGGRDEGSGIARIIVPLLAVGGIGFFLFRRQRRRQQLDADFAEVKATAQEDLLALADDIRGLDLDVEMPGVDEQAKADYGRAVVMYERADGVLDRARRPEDLETFSAAIEEGRWAMASAKARLEGREPPGRRPPCFFDPRHGPSDRDVEWSPPWGEPRLVPACEADAQMVERGLEPRAREVTVGGERTPYWNAGPAYAPWAGGFFSPFGGLFPGILIGSMLGGVFSAPVAYGGGHEQVDSGDGDFGGGDFGGGDFGGGDFGGGDFGGGDF